jgi:hypothetical protein
MKKAIFLLVLLVLAACHQPKVPTDCSPTAEPADIYPDYRGVTVPVNMAPLRFQYMQEADEVVARFTAEGCEPLILQGPKICPTFKEWQTLTAQVTGHDSISVEVFARHGDVWTAYPVFGIYVSPDSIDSWLSYRLISPSYVTYEELTINQRNLENYDEQVIYDNMLCATETKGQCINCHHSQLGNPRRTQFHARQNLGGTMLQIDGQLHKVNLKTDSTLSAGVYPAWHPKANLIAYSTNNTMQSFHTRDIDKIEVLDSQSDLILYDPEKNEVFTVENDSTEFETFPCWSPDGQWLYYCSAHFEYRDTVNGHEAEAILRYKDLRYSVYRKSFDLQTRRFGRKEMVFNADSLGLSATLPRVSPDGHWLLLAVGEWGTFHIWHRDADLWLMDLQTDSIRPMKEVNSPSVESYHTWSRNGRWVVFSSRRVDGNFTRPFFAHVDADGHATKPFELPSEDPNYHRELMKSYNVPEFLTGPVEITPQTFADALKKDARQAQYAGRR